MYYSLRLMDGLRCLLFLIIGLSILLPFTNACTRRTLIRANGLSDYEKQIVLDVHNRYRQTIALGQIRGQPPASNMMEMKWDDELASRAQKWASSCSFAKHDEGRHSSRFSVGQNVATFWTTKPPSSPEDEQPDFEDAIRRWFDEFKQYSYSRISYGGSGHYTQMIWADTYLVGCGFSFYYDPSRGFTKKYVCNYGPGGNVLGQKPYEKGYPNCVEIGMVDSRNYQGLCDKSSTYYYTFSNYVG